MSYHTTRQYLVCQYLIFDAESRILFVSYRFFNAQPHVSDSALLLVSSIDHVCHPNPCANGGICYVKNGAPYCACQDGFVGDKCQSKYF